MEEDEENIFDEFYERYYASNSYGQHLFYIEIKEWGMPEYWFESSLTFNIHDYSNLNKIINVIINKSTSSSVRKMFVEIFFRSVKNIPGIEKYYFKKTLLDKYGRFSEAISNSIENIIDHYQLKPYVPYSLNKNELIFLEIKSVFESEKENCDSRVEADKELFEGNLINDELKFAYTDVYEHNAKYFFQEGYQEDKLLEFYFMISAKSELLLLFLVNIK
jgi:hypothetical protein